MYVTSGQALALPIEFKVRDNFVVPDTNSVKVTIRNQTGGVVSGWNDVTVNHADKNTIALTITDAVNTASDREKRTVIVTFKVGGASYQVIKHYFVTPWINTTVTPDDVRNFFGTELSELPDRFISVEDAYYQAARIYTKLDLDAALVDTDMMMDANNIILGVAAFRLISVLKVRMMKSELSDEESYTRFDKLDLDQFYPRISALVGGAADRVFSRTEGNIPLFDTSVGTDAFTGL